MISIIRMWVSKYIDLQKPQAFSYYLELLLPDIRTVSTITYKSLKYNYDR